MESVDIHTQPDFEFESECAIGRVWDSREKNPERKCENEIVFLNLIPSKKPPPVSLSMIEDFYKSLQMDRNNAIHDHTFQHQLQENPPQLELQEVRWVALTFEDR